LLEPSVSINALEALRAKHQAIKTITGILSAKVDADVLPILDQALGEIAGALEVPVACLHLADPEYGQLKTDQRFEYGPGVQPCLDQAQHRRGEPAGSGF
jgi:hypothetical protein